MHSPSFRAPEKRFTRRDRRPEIHPPDKPERRADPAAVHKLIEDSNELMRRAQEDSRSS